MKGFGFTNWWKSVCQHLRPTEMFTVMFMCFKMQETCHCYGRYTGPSGQSGANNTVLAVSFI